MRDDGLNGGQDGERKETPEARGRNEDGRLGLSRRARAAAAIAVRAGAERYDRQRDLPRLIRIDPGAADCEAETIVARLARALRAERHRARSGHWTYDLNRHIALRQAFLAESERLAARRRASP